MINKRSPFRTYADATKAGHWLKGLLGIEESQKFLAKSGIGLERAGAESPDGVGGFLTPVQLDAAIIRVREQQGVFRDCEVRGATSDGQVRPRSVGAIAVNFVGEGERISESSFELDSISSNQKKIAALVRSSSELYEDSAASLADYISQELGYGLAGLEDDCGFNGTGSQAYRGISGLTTKLTGTSGAVSAAAGHDSMLEIDTGDIAAVMAAVNGSALPGCAWYCSVKAYALVFARLSATNGGLVASVGADGTLKANYLGFPVRISSKLQSATINLAGLPILIFANLAQGCLLSERRQSLISMSRHRALEADQILLRMTARMDIVVHDAVGAAAMLVGTA